MNSFTTDAITAGKYNELNTEDYKADGPWEADIQTPQETYSSEFWDNVSTQLCGAIRKSETQMMELKQGVIY